MLAQSVAVGRPAAQAPDVAALGAEFRRAYDAGEWPAAVAAGERLAEALPDDPTHAYNLACAYARSGNAERALLWLERSAARGFRRAGAMARDPDLDTVRPLPAYAGILTAVESNRTKALEAFKSRAESAPVQVVLPPTAWEGDAAPLPLIVALHGYGSTADDVAPAFAALAERAGAVLALPQAIEPAGAGFDWGELDHAEYLVMRAVDAARRRALIPPRRVVLAGFSQGASVAYAVGLRHPETFAGIIAIAGRYDDRATPIPSPRPKRMPRVAVMCGGEDRGVEQSRRAARLLEAAGLDVRLRIYEDVGHTFPPNAVSEFSEALRFVLR